MAGASYTETRLIQVDCALFDFSGKLYRKLPGWLCLFQDDGSAIVSSHSHKKFVKLMPEGGRGWRKNIPVHHSLELNSEGQILALNEEFFPFSHFPNVRFDVFSIFSQDGEELARWSTYDHFDEIAEIVKKAGKTLPYIENKKGTPFIEYTHANAFREIPVNDLYPQVPYLKPGNYILGLNCLGLFLFLDKSLKKIEGVYHYQKHSSCNTHDAQVLNNGHILHLVNFEKVPGDGVRLVELNPLTNEIVWSFKNPFSDKKLSNIKGSIQALPNGNILYIDHGQTDNKAVVEMSRSGQIVNAMEHSVFDKIYGERPYRARSGDFKKYLDNSWF